MVKKGNKKPEAWRVFHAKNYVQILIYAHAQGY